MAFSHSRICTTVRTGTGILVRVTGMASIKAGLLRGREAFAQVANRTSQNANHLGKMTQDLTARIKNSALVLAPIAFREFRARTVWPRLLRRRFNAELFSRCSGDRTGEFPKDN